MASEDIGGVSISVNVDLSDLDAQFQAAVSEAASDGQKIGQAIADGINAGASGADAFDAAMKSLVDSGSSLNDAFQTLTGSTQSFMDALQSGALTDFADNFGKIADVAGPVADALDQAAAAAKGMSDQLSLFGDVSTPFSDLSGQMNLFSDAIEVVSSDAKSLSDSLSGIGNDAAALGTELAGASGGAKQFSDAAQAIVTSQEQADAKLQEAQGALAEIQAAYEKGAVDADTLARAAQGVQSAFDAANPALDQAKTTTQDASIAAEAAQTAFGGLVSILGALGVSLSLAAFVNFAEDVGTAADSITRADISLTNLTGDAQTAADMLGQLSSLGIQDGLSMPSLRQAAQSMTEFLPEGTDVVGILSQIADGAAISGKSIETAAAAFDRIAEGASTGIRQLIALGVNTDLLKTTMNDLGIAADGTAKQILAAFNLQDAHDKIVILQTALQNFQGVAQDVAENTFGGAWKSAMAQWDTDIGIIQKDLGSIIGDLGGDLRSGITFVAEMFVTLGTTIAVTIDAAKGKISELAVEIQSIAQAASLSGSGNFAAAGAVIAGMFTQVEAIEKQTQDKIASDWAAGTKIILDLESQKTAAVKATIPALDGQGASAKSAALSMAQAMAAVTSFDATALTGAGTVGTLQAAFENAGKAINLVAKGDLPLAIQAVTDYNAAMVAAGAKASVLDAGFQEQSKLVSQLAKVDLPGAVESMANLTKVYLDGGAPIALVNAAFADTEKQIASLAKTDLPAAIEMQKDYLAVLENSQAPMNLMVQALEAQQKNFDALAKTNIQGAIDGLDKLADSEKNLNAPTQVITATLDDERSKLDLLANTNIESAISQLDKLADHQVLLNQPTQDVTKTLDDERSKLDTLANTNIQAAITGLDNLAQHQIALNQPTQDVTKTLDDERSKLDLLANTNLESAISGLDRLANEQIKLNQPTKDVTATLDDERSKIDLLAGQGGAGLTQAIQMLSNLADEQVRLNQPTADVTKTLDDERSKLDALANANLPAAIQGLSTLADQQIKLNQPTKDVTNTLDDERSKIVALGASNVPAAIDAIKGLIAQQIALKQPIDDVNASIKVQSDLLTKQVTTDLPAAIAGHQQYLDELNKQHDIYVALNADGEKTIQQQAFQISSEIQLLNSTNSVNLAYGDRLAIQAKIYQGEIDLNTKMGQDATDQIWGLEKVKLEQMALTDAAHGWADAETAAINDALKGFENMGGAMANAIVNGTNMGAALITEFKKIAASILTDLIDGALKQLAGMLAGVIASLITGVPYALTVTAAGIAGLSGVATGASTALSTMAASAYTLATAMDNVTASLAGMGGAGAGAGGADGGAGSAVGSGTSGTIGIITGIITAVGQIIGDVYLHAIDVKLFSIETSTDRTANDMANLRADQWSQYNDMYARLGEIKNDADTILVTLQAIYATGTGGTGTLGAKGQTDLDQIAANTAGIAEPINAMAANINAMAGYETSLSHLDMIDTTLGQIHDFLAVMDKDINAITTAVQYGGPAKSTTKTDPATAAQAQPIVPSSASAYDAAPAAAQAHADAAAQYDATTATTTATTTTGTAATAATSTAADATTAAIAAAQAAELLAIQAFQNSAHSDALNLLTAVNNDTKTIVDALIGSGTSLLVALQDGFKALVTAPGVSGVGGAPSGAGTQVGGSGGLGWPGGSGLPWPGGGLPWPGAIAGQGPQGAGGGVNIGTGGIGLTHEGSGTGGAPVPVTDTGTQSGLTAVAYGVSGTNESVGKVGVSIAEQIKQANALLDLGASQYSAAVDLAGQVTGLQNEIKADTELRDAAIAAGNLSLANSYQAAIDSATRQLAPLISATNAGLSQINVGMSNQVGATQDVQSSAVGTGQFIITAIGASAVTISQAVAAGAAQTGAAFGAAMAGLGGGLTPYQPGRANEPTGAGSGGSTSGAYGSPGYVPPNSGTPYGGPAGAYGGGPLAPYNPGPSLTPPTSPNTGGIPGAFPNLFPGVNPGSSGDLVLIPGPGPFTPPDAVGPSARAPVTASGTPSSQPPLTFPDPGTYSTVPGSYSSSSGSTSISGTIPGTIPYGTNTPPPPAAPPAVSDAITQAIANETAIITGLKNQAAELTKDITAAIAAGDQASAATFQTSLQGVNGELSTANTYLTEIQSLQSTTAPATVTGLSGVKASADQMAAAQKNAQTAVDNLSAQMGDLNQQLIVAEAAGNTDLVASIEAQIGTTNTSLNAANTFLSQIDADVAAGTVATTGVANDTKITNDTIKQASANINSIIGSLQTKLSTENTELINAVASGDFALATTIQGQISQTNSQLSAENGLLNQIGGFASAIASNTSKIGIPPPTPPSGTGPGSLIGNLAYSGLNLGYSYAGGGLAQSDQHARIGDSGPEAVLPPDLTAMLLRMASTPSMDYRPSNPAASAAVPPGSVVIGGLTFNVYGGSAADNVRQISAYMKIQSPKLAALSS